MSCLFVKDAVDVFDRVTGILQSTLQNEYVVPVRTLAQGGGGVCRSSNEAMPVQMTKRCRGFIAIFLSILCVLYVLNSLTE